LYWQRHALSAAYSDNLLKRPAGELPILLPTREHLLGDKLMLRYLNAESDKIDGLLCQYDVLSALVAIAATQSAESYVFYPSFAKYYSERTVPIVRRVVSDAALKSAIWPLTDEDLAIALSEIDRAARQVGWFHGWSGYQDRTVTTFIERNLPKAGK
jgi:hypothetical protein